MKKYALLFLIVLGISSTALGYCRLCIDVQEPECDATTLTVCGSLCCSGQCTLVDPASDIRVRQLGNQILVDVCLTCDCLQGCTCLAIDECGELPLSCPLRCGLYVLVVRVWCTYEGCACYPYNMFSQPLFCGMAMDSFKVCCDECGCYPCCCGFSWPCCLR